MPSKVGKRSLSGTPKFCFHLRWVGILWQAIASNIYANALYLSYTSWKKCKYLLCPTIVFPIGQSKINIYYCLGPYYKYFSSYSILKSSVYQLNPNMDIKYAFLCLNGENLTVSMIMIFVCFCIFFLSGNFKSCSCCLMSWLVKHLMPQWELSKSLNTFLLKFSWHFCLFDLMYDFHS